MGIDPHLTVLLFGSNGCLRGGGVGVEGRRQNFGTHMSVGLDMKKGWPPLGGEVAILSGCYEFEEKPFTN